MDRISACEANNLAMVRLCEDLKKDIEGLSRANRNMSMAMRDIEKRLNEIQQLRQIATGQMESMRIIELEVQELRKRLDEME
jgi:hypothetical protein